MKKFALILLSVVTLPIAAQAQDINMARFCAEVNAQKQSCQTQRHDCSFMMGDLDPATLDTIDLIKSCPPGKADPAVLQSRQYPDIAKLACCLGNGLR